VGSNSTTCRSRDILSSRRRVLILYWLPASAIVVAGAPAISSGWRTVVWTVAIATMGMALMALVALSYGLGILRLGGNGWNLLGLITLIGAMALWCLPEMFLGKYRQDRTGDGNRR
jgi:hypothetical protein